MCVHCRVPVVLETKTKRTNVTTVLYTESANITLCSTLKGCINSYLNDDRFILVWKN